MSDLQENQNEVIEKLRRELRTTRIFSTISSFLMVCILVGGFLVCNYARNYVEQFQPLLTEVSKVDFAAINESMETLNEAVGAVDWEEVAGQLEQLDVEAINEAIAQLDTEELSKALTNINDAAETLQKLSEGMKGFTAKFGF